MRPATCTSRKRTGPWKASRAKARLIMAVDNLPCELPREASESFSRALTPFVKEMADADFSASFTALKLPDPIKKAVIVHRGGLCSGFRVYAEFCLGPNKPG
ncbi:MAG: hypothetical protein ABIK28_02630 [Planctomycetota bacterium]